MNRQSGYLCVLAFVCLQFLATQTLAQDAPAEPAADPFNTTQDQALQQVKEELTDLESRWYGLMRLRWSYPQKFSAGFGAIFVQQPKETDCSISCMVHGWHFEVEPGLYGIQGSVGWGKLVGETGRSKRLIHTVHFGWAVRGMVLRTWGDSPLRPQSQTLAGVEADLSIIKLNFSLGVLRSFSSHADREWVYTAGMAWGF